MWIYTSGFQTTALHLLHVSLIDTLDSDHQLVRKGLHELRWMGQMCRAVGPEEQDWKSLFKIFNLFFPLRN